MRPHNMTHLTGIFATAVGASTDHVVCDHEVVVEPAVGEDVHIHRPQYRGQAVSVEPGHAPAADCAPGIVSQRSRIRCRQRGRLNPGIDRDWPVQLTNTEQTLSQHKRLILKKTFYMFISPHTRRFSSGPIKGYFFHNLYTLLDLQLNDDSSKWYKNTLEN